MWASYMKLLEIGNVRGTLWILRESLVDKYRGHLAALMDLRTYGPLD